MIALVSIIVTKVGRTLIGNFYCSSRKKTLNSCVFIFDFTNHFTFYLELKHFCINKNDINDNKTISKRKYYENKLKFCYKTVYYTY